MEDRETPRMHKYWKVKWLELWWQMYIFSPPERDVRNFRPLDFCWTECTCPQLYLQMHSVMLHSVTTIHQTAYL